MFTSEEMDSLKSGEIIQIGDYEYAYTKDDGDEFITKWPYYDHNDIEIIDIA